MNELSADDDDQNSKFPKGYLQLFSEANIVEPCEGFVVLLHAFMLEVGYVPKDVDEADIHKSMPEDWRVGGIFNLLYSHKSIPEVFCRVTCVPLYSNLAIHGLLENDDIEDRNVYLKVKVNTEGDVSDPWSLLPCLHKLSLVFKDEFCFPLLMLLQDSANYEPSFGLSGLISEAKFIILNLLPVESVVSMSAVNKDFHKQVNSSYLWKCLFSRDYGKDNFTDRGASGTSSSEENWKEIYKKEYLKRKRRPRSLRPRFTPYYLPEIYPIRSDFDTDVDLRIDMDTALQQAFPLMRDRFRPSYWLFRGENHPFNPHFF